MRAVLEARQEAAAVRVEGLGAELERVRAALADAEWLNARSSWILLLCWWACTLTGALLGLLTSRTFFETRPLPPVAAQLPWAFGGSFTLAVTNTAGTLRRRRRERDR